MVQQRLFSYGSGACAEMYCGTVQAAAHKTLSRHNVKMRLSDRQLADMAQYEATVKELEVKSEKRDYTPHYDKPEGLYNSYYRNQRRLVLEKIENYHRKYRWSDT